MIKIARRVSHSPIMIRLRPVGQTLTGFGFDTLFFSYAECQLLSFACFSGSWTSHILASMVSCVPFCFFFFVSVLLETAFLHIIAHSSCDGLCLVADLVLSLCCLSHVHKMGGYILFLKRKKICLSFCKFMLDILLNKNQSDN